MDNISPKCIAPNFCSPGSLESMCLDCQVKLEDLAVLSALNMGAPDQFGCGLCGQWFLPEDFAEHMVGHANP